MICDEVGGVTTFDNIVDLLVSIASFLHAQKDASCLGVLIRTNHPQLRVKKTLLGYSLGSEALSVLLERQ